MSEILPAVYILYIRTYVLYIRMYSTYICTVHTYVLYIHTHCTYVCTVHTYALYIRMYCKYVPTVHMYVLYIRMYYILLYLSVSKYVSETQYGETCLVRTSKRSQNLYILSEALTVRVGLCMYVCT